MVASWQSQKRECSARLFIFVKKEDFIFMNIQVTSPLRKVEYIYTVFDMFKDCDHLVSITKPKLSKSLFMDE